MIETILLSVMIGQLPTPHFEVRLPIPHFDTTLPPSASAVVPAKPDKSDPSARDPRGRIVRLPGPRNYFVCPECQRTDDWMYLGDHLRRQHGKSMTEIGGIKYWELGIWHDNLHNLNWKPGATVTVQDSCTTCEGGACSTGPIRRLIGRWR